MTPEKCGVSQLLWEPTCTCGNEATSHGSPKGKHPPGSICGAVLTPLSAGRVTNHKTRAVNSGTKSLGSKCVLLQGLQ